MEVKTELGKKNVKISVDGEESTRVQLKGHTLDVEGNLYLGGLPSTYIPRRIGNVRLQVHPHPHPHFPSLPTPISHLLFM